MANFYAVKKSLQVRKAKCSGGDLLSSISCPKQSMRIPTQRTQDWNQMYKPKGKPGRGNLLLASINRLSWTSSTYLNNLRILLMEDRNRLTYSPMRQQVDNVEARHAFWQIWVSWEDRYRITHLSARSTSPFSRLSLA